MDSLNLTYTAIGIAAAACLLSIWALVRQSKINRRLVKISAENGEIDLLAVSSAHAEELEAIGQRLGRITGKLAEIDADIAASLRHLSVVRFNALSEVGGQFSFAVAMLDDDANGIIFTSIQGNTHGRVYAKPIMAGKSDAPLSPEELQALENAKPRGAK